MIPVPKPPKRVKIPKRMNDYNEKRQGRAFGAECRDDDFTAWLRTFACAICSALKVQQETSTEVEHWEKRSHGGHDKGSTFPTCAYHRELRHGEPRAFAALLKRLKIVPAHLCAWFARKYDAEHFPCP